ncbi:hypothetical protein D3C80_971960 [compost metagenome]
MLFQVFGQIFRHAFGQRGNQHTLVDRHPLADFGKQIVHLGGHRPHFDLRIQQPGWAHHLIDNVTTGFFQLVFARRCRHIDSLWRQRFELFKAQRAVVQRRRQAETVFHQRFLA